MKKLELLEALYQISRSMHTLNIDELLHLILEGVTKTIGFDRARLYLYEEEQQMLELKMAVGMKKEEIQNIAIPIYQGESVIAQALLKKQPIVVTDAENDPRVHRGLTQLFHLKSFAAIPLMGREKVKGVITADHLYSQEKVTEEQVEALMMFAHEAGLALENAEIYQKLQNISFRLADEVQMTSQDLSQTLEHLEKSKRLAVLGQLAAGVAHEIRNPLTSIKILIHSLLTEKEERRRQEDAAVITQEIERLEKIVNDFLEFGHLRPPKLEGIKVRTIFDHVAHLLHHDFKKRQIDFDMELPNKEVWIVADKEQLCQIFINLIMNAMDALGSQKKKGAIRARVSRTDQQVQIRIEDNGPGIAKEIRDRLFVPFTTSKEGGVGLGLSIVHRIMDSFNGSVQLEETGGKGASFLLTFHPYEKEEAVL